MSSLKQQSSFSQWLRGLQARLHTLQRSMSLSVVVQGAALLPTALVILPAAHLNELSGSEAHGSLLFTSHAPENLEEVPVLSSSSAQ